MLRQFRRAPGRILASVLALALAVAAIGVLAIPTVSEGTLHEAVERDGLADIIVTTTPLESSQIDAIASIDGVARAEGQATVAVRTSDGFLTRMIGLDFDAQTMDIVQVEAGRLPTDAGEVVTSPAIGAIGDAVFANGERFEIVGHGGTVWWSDSDVLYASLDDALELQGVDGTNRLVVAALDDSADSLRTISDEIRLLLADDNDTYTSFPTYLPDGSTPIDQDIDQVSSLIGLLGIFAGLVALVLLASTTNTLIVERTREVAVMRALGGNSRQLGRRLRRLAMGITAAALVIGLPLGVLISNLIARMVLEEFVGITPDFAVSWTVLGLSAVGALVGARVVSARAARRVVKRPLAEALRDRDGDPFGRRWSHRAAARVLPGGLMGKLATRANLHRPARTMAVVAQISAAVAAAFLIPSLATSVNEFNTASSAPWSWESVTVARDPGLPIDAAAVEIAPGTEAGVWVEGEVSDWQIDVFGISPDTEMFDPMLREGSWFAGAERGAVMSAGFAGRNDISVGDDISVELAAGTTSYTVVGLADDFSRSIYVDRDDIAGDLGTPGGANTIWSDDPAPTFVVPTALRTTTQADLSADDEAGRRAIVMIFGAIGAIVAGVAALAVLSSMTVSLYERRHELAALQSLGASRRRLRGLLARELVPLAAIGIVGGLALGALGTAGIIGSFEASNAVDIGVVYATGLIPAIAVGAVAGLGMLMLLIVRRTSRRPVAETLRSAA